MMVEIVRKIGNLTASTVAFLSSVEGLFPKITNLFESIQKKQPHYHSPLRWEKKRLCDDLIQIYNPNMPVQSTQHTYPKKSFQQSYGHQLK